MLLRAVFCKQQLYSSVVDDTIVGYENSCQGIGVIESWSVLYQGLLHKMKCTHIGSETGPE